MAAVAPILVTGASEFVGSALLSRALLRHTRHATFPPAQRFIAIVRDRTRFRRKLLQTLAAEAHSRRATSTAPWPSANGGGDVDVHALAARVDVIESDLTDPALYTSDALAAVQSVVHCAADTSYRADVTRSTAHNVDASERLFRRCAANAGFQRFVHVSTAYACANAFPLQTVSEDRYPHHTPVLADHFYAYSFTKAVAEQRLRAAAKELHATAALVVARPSIVVGHSALGCALSGSIFFAFRAVDALRRTCWPLDTPMDVVPVDWVADALAALATAQHLRHFEYHLTAGRSACNWHDIGRAFRASAGANNSHDSTSVTPRERLARPHVRRHRLSGSYVGREIERTAPHPLQPLLRSQLQTPPLRFCQWTQSLHGLVAVRSQPQRLGPARAVTPPASPYERVACSAAELFGRRSVAFGRTFPQHTSRYAFAMQLYARYAALGTTFSNDRLLSERLAVAPPRFASYIPLCLATGKSMDEQLLEDF